MKYKLPLTANDAQGVLLAILACHVRGQRCAESAGRRLAALLCVDYDAELDKEREATPALEL